MYKIAGIEMLIISSGYNCLHLQEYNTQNLTRRVVVIMASDCEGRTQQQIGQKIEEWRKKVGLSQLDLAMVLGLKSDRHYRRICIECTDEDYIRKTNSHIIRTVIDIDTKLEKIKFDIN